MEGAIVDLRYQETNLLRSAARFFRPGVGVLSSGQRALLESSSDNRFRQRGGVNAEAGRKILVAAVFVVIAAAAAGLTLYWQPSGQSSVEQPTVTNAKQATQITTSPVNAATPALQSHNDDAPPVEDRAPVTPARRGKTLSASAEKAPPFQQSTQSPGSLPRQ